MDAIKNEHKIVYLSVWGVILLLSGAARMQILACGGDTSTAWIVFVGVCILLGGLHLMIESCVYSAVSLFFLEKKNIDPEEPQPVEQTTSEEPSIITEVLDTIVEEQQAEVSAETIEQPEEAPVAEPSYDYENVRTNYFEAQRQEQLEKLERVLSYTREIFAPHLKDEAIEALCRSVEAFLIQRKVVAPPIAQHPSSEITTTDLKHYGWNIAQPFGIERKKVAEFLKVVFVHTLRNLEHSSISRKLTDNPNGGVIKIERDRSER